MKPAQPPIVNVSTKASIGITDFDEITGSGLPHGRTTLLVNENILQVIVK
jgi:hypothetical protein